MKSLIFSLSYFPMVGGAEIAIKEITDRISKSDIEFDLVTMRFNKKEPRFEVVGNVNVYRIGGGFGYLSKIVFVIQAILFALKRNYDFYWVIMTYMLFPVSILRFLGLKTPYVLTLQDGDPFEKVFKRKRIYALLPILKYGFRHANKVHAISGFLAKWALDMGHKNNVEIIPNGVDIKKFKKTKQKFFEKGLVKLITTSRLVEKNGVSDIIKSLKYLPENVYLDILGAGPLEIELKTLTKKLDLESRVFFHGFVNPEKLPEKLAGADIFVRPSLSEGMGNSFIEAMASGLPVIATPVGGILDFIDDRETGLLCNPRDPESIATAVKILIQDESLRNKIVQNGIKLSNDKYDWDLITKKIKDSLFKLK